MGRLIGAVLMTLIAAMLLVIAAPVASAAEPNGDPSTDDYSPWVWLQAWGTAGAIDDARAADVTEGLQHSGMVIAMVPDQLNALTAADKAQLETAWRGNGLLQLTYDRARMWATTAFADTHNVPAWSAADADSVAGNLGASSYAELSPGLKSVVQRIATIVTGDTKPVMPDEEWASWMTPSVKAGWDARPDTRFDWAGVSQTPPGVVGDPGSQVTMQCNAGPALNWLCQATQAVAGAVVATVDFVSNPLGYLAAAFSAAAAGMMTFIATVANHGTAPDLTASWWISAYTKGLAIGVVLLGFVLLVEIVQVARRKASADDLLETVSIWVPAWFAGVLFGPAVAQFLITGSGYLTDGIVSSMTGYGAGDAFTAVAQATKDASQLQQLGELVMALLTAIAVLVSSLAVFISLCLQAVIIYGASAVFAVGWVWIVTQKHRDTAWRIPLLFLGVVFSKALLFFLLGVAMAIASAATAMTGDGIGKNLGLIVMACAAMLLAAFSPLILLKHAPVIPGTSTSREADGVTAGGAARAGRDAGTAARGAGQAGKGLNKLSALAARSRQGNTGPVIGGGERPSRTPAPTPTADPTGKSSAAGGTGSGAARAGRPNPTSIGGGATAPGRGGTGSPSGSSGAAGGTRPGPAGPGRPAGRARTNRTGTSPTPAPAGSGHGTGAAAAASTATPADPNLPTSATASGSSWAGAAAPTPARAAGAWQTRLAREFDGTGPDTKGRNGSPPVAGESS